MEYTELTEKAKSNAAFNVYEKIPINWEGESDFIVGQISEILDKYHCSEKEINFGYEYGKAYFSEIETSFDVEELLKEREELKELLEELEEESDGYSDLYFSFSSSKTEVSYSVDFLSKKELEEMWKYIKKYTEEFELEINKLEISLLFGNEIDVFEKEIKELFEIALQKNGDKIAKYLYPKVEKMRSEIVDTIEKTYQYLESSDYIKDYLNDYPDEFNFDENGNQIEEDENVNVKIA